MQLDAITIETGRGAILATDESGSAPKQLLPFVFLSYSLAQQFLSACERSGVQLWPGQSHQEIVTLYRLWFDSFKHPTPNAQHFPQS